MLIYIRNFTDLSEITSFSTIFWLEVLDVVIVLNAFTILFVTIVSIFALTIVSFISSYIKFISERFVRHHKHAMVNTKPVWVYRRQMLFIAQHNKYLNHFNILTSSEFVVMYSISFYLCMALNAYMCYRLVFVNGPAYENIVTMFGILLSF